MIGHLRGTLLDIDIETGFLTLAVEGVGYELEVAVSVLSNNPEPNGELALYTHMVVREDAQLLYGFANKAERDLFRGFIKISGVGPKLALALISSIDPSALVVAVRNNDVSLLTRVPGVGKKTAERLMVELKNRIDALTKHSRVPMSVVSVGAASDNGPAEAEDALIALGYRPQDAARVVGVVMQAATDTLSTEEIVRQALRSFASSA